MRDYLNTLEDQLLDLAHTADRPAPAPTAAPRRRITPRFAIPAATIVAGALVGALAISGGPAAPRALAVPILAAPPVDVTDSKVAELLRANGVDLEQARRIVTPTGTGYVVPDRDERRFCLIVPDPIDGYGTGCSTLAEIQRHGLTSTMSPTANDPSSPATFVVVLPQKADAPTVTFEDGTSTTLKLRDGVATLETHQDATITYRTGTEQPPMRLKVRATHPAAKAGP